MRRISVRFPLLGPIHSPLHVPCLEARFCCRGAVAELCGNGAMAVHTRRWGGMKDGERERSKMIAVNHGSRVQRLGLDWSHTLCVFYFGRGSEGGTQEFDLVILNPERQL